MGAYFGRIFISLFALALAFPSLAISFPAFNVFKEGGVSLKPGDLRVGRIKLHPGFAFDTRYDSNILNEADQTYTGEDRTDDFIFTNIPSMGVALERAPGEVFGFYLDYEGRDENFLEEGGAQSFFNHEIDGGVNLGGPGGRGDVTIGGGWEKSAAGIARDFITNIGARQSRISADAFVDLRYSLSKILKLQLNAAVVDNKYQGQKLQNVDEYNLGGSVFWQATKPVAFGVKYNHRMRRYETPSPSNDDSDADQIYLAMRWEPTSLVSGEIAVGYDTKRFENIEGDNAQNLVYLIDMLYRPMKRTSVTLGGTREIVDSTFGTIQAFVLSNAKLGIGQQLGKKVGAYINFEYENRDYQRSATDSSDGRVKTRIDNTYSGTAGFKYQIQKWLEARASYQYEENISSFERADYKKHVGALTIAAHY